MAVNVGSVTVSLDRAHLKARMERGADAAGAALAEQVLSDCNQYAVPDDGEHILKNSGRVEKFDDGYAVTWNTVYAAYQFYGCWPDGSHQIHNHTQGYTENPSIMWTEPARARYGDDWEIVAQKEFVRGADS
jgi:hypothetical protein